MAMKIRFSTIFEKTIQKYDVSSAFVIRIEMVTVLLVGYTDPHGTCSYIQLITSPAISNAMFDCLKIVISEKIKCATFTSG